MKIFINDERDMINMSMAEKPCTLDDFFHFRVPIRDPFVPVWFELYFGTFKKNPTGRLHVELKLDDKVAATYNVGLEQIIDNVPLRFTLNKKIRVLKALEVHINIEYSSQDKIAIWTNSAGPSMKVHGEYKCTYNLKKTPIISIITPVYDVELGYFKEAVDSVLSQYYKKWEWCIVDDGSSNKDLKKYLKTLNDPRIKLKINRKNRGISAASNEALKMASGEYIALLDHDDVLTTDALLQFVDLVNKTDDVKMAYTDEDKISENGELFQPFYKPDWSYEMFLSQMYTCHLSFFERKLVDELGGFDSYYDGSQDYDMTLRVIEKIDASQIYHITKVCYHWRSHRSSTAYDISTKPFAHNATIKALKAHVKRAGKKAIVTSGSFPHTYSIDWEVSSTPLLPIEIIIPSKDNISYLKPCIESLLQSTYSNFIVTVVDNGSQDIGTLRYLKELENQKVNVLRYNKPFNYSAINNFAVETSGLMGPPILLFLNDDVEVITPDWLEKMVQHYHRQENAVVGAQLLYPNYCIQHAGVIIGIGGVAGHSHKHIPVHSVGYFNRPNIVQNVSAVTGACLMIKRAVFEEIGGFEEKLPRAFNDIDLCLKVRRAGYNIVYTPNAKLFHYESVSRGLDNYKEKIFKEAVDFMQRKWSCYKYEDPYYNTNLTLQHENFSLKGF